MLIHIHLGLIDRTCSGPCRPGYYCPRGSISAVSKICPPGRFGSTAGLQDELCSGPCEAGYYCPAGSQSSTAVECGSPAVFCPANVGSPIVVGFGNYSVGSVPTRRQAQSICPLGFYCRDGVVHSCPAGTYGAVSGLNFANAADEVLDEVTGLDISLRAAADASNTVVQFPPDRYICSGMSQ